MAGRLQSLHSFIAQLCGSVVRETEERVTASSLHACYQPIVGVRRVQQLMQDADHLRWSRMKSVPRLTTDHKRDRVVRQLNVSPSKWSRTIFSEEKRFCLDGPDGNLYHWTDKRLDPRYFSTRQKGGGGVMAWGCFSAICKPNLAVFEGTPDTVGYCTILEKVLLPFAEDKFPDGWIFQQDNAQPHISHHIKTFFTDMDIDVSD